MTVTAINTPIQVGRYKLSNRLVLAPLTRVRNSTAPQDPGVPPSYAPLYYTQRANKGGLLITEATFIAHEASGFPGAPGVYSRSQIESWKRVTEAVHSKGGLIFMQLWALGRVASPKIVKVCGPSNDTYNDVEVSAFTEADIDRYVENYRQGALNAIEAGFDGVEIHGANGYLLDQFLQSVSNKRTDAYGGSLENRFKFPLRALNAICEAIGADRVGIRMSPFSSFQGMKEQDPLATFVPWTKAIVTAQPKLAYIHAVEGRISGPNDVSEHPAESLDPIRSIVDDAGIAFIAAGGYTAESGAKVVEDHGGLVAFGRHYIANPDLLARIVNGWDLNKYNRSTFYTKGQEGYTDYPTYEESKL